MIRYDKKLNKEIRRIVNKYNAKIRRTAAKDSYSLLYIPNKITAADLKLIKQTSRTRNDLRRRLSELEEYTKRGGEIIQASGIPVYQEKIAKRYRKAARAKITRTRKYYETHGLTNAGVEEPLSMSYQFDENIRTLNRLSDITNRELTASNIEDYIYTMRGNLRDVNNRQWQQNYTNMILDTSYLANISHERVHAVREKLMSLTPEQFANLTKRERLVKNIIFYYKSINELGLDVTSENYEEEIVQNFNELEKNLDIILAEYKR